MVIAIIAILIACSYPPFREFGRPRSERRCKICSTPAAVSARHSIYSSKKFGVYPSDLNDVRLREFHT